MDAIDKKEKKKKKKKKSASLLDPKERGHGSAIEIGAACCAASCRTLHVDDGMSRLNRVSFSF